MKAAAKFLAAALGLFAFCFTLPAQQMKKPSAPPTIASVMNQQFGIAEYQFVSAAEAMPADKYNFAPTDGNYKGVRTFAQEVKHVATANNYYFDVILGQPVPAAITANKQSNGPDDIQTKEQILKYLKDSFALGHKAIATITPENALTPVKGPAPFLSTRLMLASFASAHTFDHYGQVVEYLRMNGIVPPASQGQPPANPSSSK